MKAVDFIKQVKAEGKALPVWFVEVRTYEDGDNASPDYRNKETDDSLYFDYDQAYEAMKEIADEQQADFGERIEVNLMKAEIGPDDLDDVDWEAVEDMGEAAFGDSELMDIIEESGSADWTNDERVIHYEYESVEGALLVFWSWDRYVGYARNFEEVRSGYYKETTEMCIPIDKTFSRQCTVLAKASELEGLTDQERYDLIEERLHNGYKCGAGEWKWTFKAEARIEDYLGEIKPKDEEE